MAYSYRHVTIADISGHTVVLLTVIIDLQKMSSCTSRVRQGNVCYKQCHFIYYSLLLDPS